MLSKIRHWLVLFLFCALPFHALFVTLGTKVIAGPGNAPMTMLAVWKELVIVVIFVVGILELMKGVRFQVVGVREFIRSWKSDPPTIIVLLLVTLSVLLPTTYHLPPTTYVFGFKYTLLPLVFFLLLKNLEWDSDFLPKLTRALMVIGGIVAGYGILTFFLPQSFFTALGYSDAHSLYSPGSSLSAFQYISDTGIRRIQSTFSGPNQLGLWLLLPWSILLIEFLKNTKMRKYENAQIIFLIIVGSALLLTFSRSAWIAALIITLVACGFTLRGKVRMSALASITGAAILAVFILTLYSPGLIHRGISNKHHFERTRDGIRAMISSPLGHGLGTAGPASNRFSDPCVYFEEGADISWAADRPDLCLFVGGTQAQPSLEDHACNCPVLPENWYVQVGYELGVIGFVLFVTLILVLYRRLAFSDGRLENDLNAKRSSLIALLPFLGISFAALFLHAWEDAAVAYTIWGIVGVTLSLNHATHSPDHTRPSKNIMDT